ncbi:MAG TPA: AmmeMemoRadiSam system radical SAM enzyme [Methanocorpusculum sp.]|nr:AmmeMemoRadiSam system radical SAM enzyme [Methanocorpusculum sp.]
MQARFFDAETCVCNLCARHCRILPGHFGFCRVRENVSGLPETKTYGELTACGIDPVEKKPLNHFLPRSSTLSISSFGCNFTCLHCQNHMLSQCADAETVTVSPEEVVSLARREQVQSISFTYNEPTVFYEYMYDVSRLARKAGIKTAMITNGYLSEDAVSEIAPYMDAFRIDLKAFSDEFYRTVCGNAHLQPVLDTILRVSELKRHLELVTLIIPGKNDSPEELASMLEWELERLGPAVPHHFTAFSPQYLMRDVPAASKALMDRVFNQAKTAGLYYPYIGNVIHTEGGKTYCPSCGSLLIQRAGYTSYPLGMKDGCCAQCGRKIEGIF